MIFDFLINFIYSLILKKSTVYYCRAKKDAYIWDSK